MLQLFWPWALAALPLPLFAWLLLPAASAGEAAALKVPFYQRLAALSSERKAGAIRRAWWLSLLAVLAWICLVLAAARPQWLGDPIALPVSGRDLMLAVDLSGSMRESDLRIQNQQVTRLDVVKVVLGDFIKRRKGDRLGLVLFGERAYLQTPLTFDRTTVEIMLAESEIGLAGNRTSIGDSIGLSIKHLRERPEESRVLILLTDGANTAGEIEPIKAAELAKQAGIRIHTIGVGADEAYQRTFMGVRRVNPSRDLDEKTLQAVADMTGGQYFRARDTQELEGIYRKIDELEPVEVEAETFRPMTPLFYWPLGAAFGLSALLLMAMGRFRPV
ncbi:MAG: VWA domain-containing protein [Pseudomonadota bacterium]